MLKYLFRFEGTILLYITHSILALRLYGSYRSKVLGYFLLTLLCLASATEIYVLAVFAPTSKIVNLGRNFVCIPFGAAGGALIWYAVLSNR